MYIYIYCYFYSFIYLFIIFAQTYIYIYIYSMCIAHTHTGFCLLLTVSLFQSRLIAATEDMPIWPSISFWVSSVPCIPNYDISTRVSRQNMQSTFCQQPMHWRNGLWSHNQTISEAWPAEGKVPDTRYSHQPNPQLIAYQAPAHHSPCLVRFANLMFLTLVMVFQLVFVVIFSRLCPQYFIAFGGLGIIAVWQQQGKIHGTTSRILFIPIQFQCCKCVFLFSARFMSKQRSATIQPAWSCVHLWQIIFKQVLLGWTVKEMIAVWFLGSSWVVWAEIFLPQTHRILTLPIYLLQLADEAHPPCGASVLKQENSQRQTGWWTWHVRRMSVQGSGLQVNNSCKCSCICKCTLFSGIPVSKLDIIPTETWRQDSQSRPCQRHTQSLQLIERKGWGMKAMRKMYKYKSNTKALEKRPSETCFNSLVQCKPHRPT